jgi:hypothetical protein
MDKFSELERFEKDIALSILFYRKKLDSGELLPYDWIVKHFFKGIGIGFFMTCHENAIFQIYSKEFIETLANQIKKLNPKKVIEVGAGDGRLSYFLNKHGVNSKPIDNHAWAKCEDDKNVVHITYPPEVEKIDYRNALRKYNPDLVILCWEELSAKYTQKILDYPSVKYVIWIGEHAGGCTGSEDTFMRYKNEELENDCCLCRTDHSFGGRNIHKHTGVYLFYPKVNKCEK